MSLFNHDRRILAQTNCDGIVGVDEAGRGCFAGPVVAGCVWVKPSFFEHSTAVKRADFINDSKQMSADAREEVFALINFWAKTGDLIFAAGTADVQEIAAHNILGATRLAMGRAIDGVVKLAGTPEENPPFAIAGTSDSPLFLEQKSFPRMLVDGRPLVPFVWAHEAIVHGDATSLAIALASIVAKVSRDHMMQELAKAFPQYGFEIHKGYGTAQHISALKKFGICPLHRLKFLRNLAADPACDIPGLRELFPAEETAEQSEFDF